MPDGKLAPGRNPAAGSRGVRLHDAGWFHGLFGDDRQRAAWLARFKATAAIRYDDVVERTLDALAAHLATHLNIDRLLKRAQ